MKEENCSGEKRSEIKEGLVAEVVLTLRDPKHFPMGRKFSHEEIAILVSPSEGKALSRMTICTAEKSALRKLKAKFNGLGIMSVNDALDVSKASDRTVSSAYVKG